MSIKKESKNTSLKKCKLFKLGLVLLLCLATLNGCFLSSPSPVNKIEKKYEEDEVEYLTEENELEDEQFIKEQGASAQLRIWWLKRETLNPLQQDLDFFTQATFNLIFNGLIEIQKDLSLKYKLAEQITYSEDQMEVVIQLRPGIKFHNGQALIAEDVVSSILARQAYLMNKPEKKSALPLLDSKNNPLEKDTAGEAAQAAWETEDNLRTQAMKAIETVEVLEENRILIKLNAVVFDFSRSLTFPILPQEQVNVADLSLIYGTGDYQMSAYNEEGLTINAVNDMGNGVSQILIREYNSNSDAKKAFEKDEIDMSLININKYPFYAKRRQGRFSLMKSQQLLFLCFQTKGQAFFAEAEHLFAVKQILALTKLTSNKLEVYGEETNQVLPSQVFSVPSRTDDFDKIYQDMAQKEFMSLDTSQFSKYTRIVLLLPQDTPYTELAKKIENLLKDAGLWVDVQQLDEIAYSNALLQGNYDIALCQKNVADLKIPADFYQDADEQIVNQWIPPKNDEKYVRAKEKLAVQSTYWLQKWTIPNGSEDEDSTQQHAFRKEWLACSIRSAYLPICYEYAAIALNKRVKGQLKSNIFNPYDGIENLWVWAGKS